MIPIFDSDIQVSELEKAIQENLKTTSKFGTNVSFKDLGGGNGLVTQVGLLTADWSPADDSLPCTFAVKVAAPAKQSNGNQLSDLTQATMDETKYQRIVNYHNTEIFILNKLKKNNVVVKLPEVYAAKERENYHAAGYIIMRHYAGVANCHMNNNLPDYAIEDLIHQLAEIHKASQYFTSEEKEKMRGKMFQDTFNVFFEPNMIKNLGGLIKKFGGEMMVTETAEIEGVLEEMRQPEYLRWIDETCENMGLLQVLSSTLLGISQFLCHGDVWMCNMLWTRTGEDEINEKYELQALIDFQAAQFFCPAADLVRLFTGCMSGKDRRDKWEDHLKTWWSSMRIPTGEASYTYQQIVEAYCRLFPACAFIVAGSIGAVGDMIIKKQPDEEKQRKAHKNLLEKQQALLQDIIKYHKRNMSLIKGESCRN